MTGNNDPFPPIFYQDKILVNDDNKWYNFDVTSYVKDRIEYDKIVFSFDSDEGYLGFLSKDGTYDKLPQLEIEFS